LHTIPVNGDIKETIGVDAQSEALRTSENPCFPEDKHPQKEWGRIKLVRNFDKKILFGRHA